MNEIKSVLQQQVEGISLVNLIIISIWACIIVGIVFLIRVLWFHKDYSWATILSIMCLTIYLCTLIYLTLGNRELGSRDDARWIPFTHLIQSNGELNSTAWILAGLNLILFLPFGIVMTLLKKCMGIKRCFLCITLESFFLSLGIEVIQRITKLGYFEIEDILLNTLGGMIGWGIVSILLLLLRIPYARD